jgi:hypothetical protein
MSWLQLVVSVVLIGVDIAFDEEFPSLNVGELFKLDVAMHHEEVVAIATTFGGL